MFINSLTERGAMPALVATLSYTEQRHQSIAENIANIDTPGYRARRLDPGLFQQAVGKALKERGSDVRKPFEIDGTREFEMTPRGSVKVTPVDTPLANVMFHDGTTMSIEQEMSDLASNAMLHQAATSLLKGQYERLMSAIRGRA